MIYSALFYLFAFLITASAVGVVLSRNPVYSVLLLIFVFFQAAGLFVLLGAEFLAMTLVIVYVGAVAILFLFVVMMLNINAEEVKSRITKHIAFVGILGALFLFELVAVFYFSFNEPLNVPFGAVAINADYTNAAQIGGLLYTDYGYLFQISGFILLTAIVCAVVLTYNKKVMGSRKHQSLGRQLARNKANSVKLQYVKKGEGVDVVR